MVLYNAQATIPGVYNGGAVLHLNSTAIQLQRSLGFYPFSCRALKAYIF